MRINKFLITGIIMLLVAMAFFIYALSHPTFSFPNSVTLNIADMAQWFYLIYLIIDIFMLIIGIISEIIIRIKKPK